MLTIFTAPKSFQNQIALIQRNAVKSWLALGPSVEVLLIGDEEGLKAEAQALQVKHIPQVDRNPQGTPLISSIFDLARKEAQFPILCYVNADIIFLDDFLPALERVAHQFENYLIIGQRWDLAIQEPLAEHDGWIKELRQRLQAQGKLHPPAGSDYFVFPKNLFPSLPPFALGRAGWDNWMIYAGRAARVPVIDASDAITVIHQDHDYAHLPDGKPHYELPESQANISLAGGREAIFRLPDADWRLTEFKLIQKRLLSSGFLRRLEAAWIARLGVGKTARMVRMLFHPIETWTYYLGAVKRRLRSVLPGG